MALNPDTGEYKWHFQTIHHDLWDWDLPAPPVLFDVTVDGRRIPALAETGKPGLMYILNRETGEVIEARDQAEVLGALGRHGIEAHLRRTDAQKSLPGLQ